VAQSPSPGRGAFVAFRTSGPQDLRSRGPQPPTAGPGEIVVDVRACGVNRVHRALSGGTVAQLLPPRGAPYVRAVDAAGTVIAMGEGVTRFAVGDQVFGHFPAGSWAWGDAPWVRTRADAPDVELRPEGLDPVAAAALAECGLTSKTILRAAELRPGHMALVIGATFGPGPLLVSLLAETGARVVAEATLHDDAYVRSLGARETIEDTTADLVADELAGSPGVDLLVDLVHFREPYIITARATSGRLVTTLPGPEADAAACEIGVPHLTVSAEPGDLAGLVQRVLAGPQPVAIAGVYALTDIGRALADAAADEPPLALAG
jgi:NADPH2:quinone reductase